MLKRSLTLALLPLLATFALGPVTPAIAAGTVDDCCSMTAPVKAASTLDVSILGTTDVHGHLFPTNYFGDKGHAPVGLSRVYTLIKKLRAERKHTLLVDSGDSLQGTPLTYVSARVDTQAPNPMVAAYNAMGYDAFAVGNHEYNYGLPYLMKARKEAHYPFLSANIYFHGTHKPVFTPYIFKTIDGAKIAIVGFTTPGIAIWDHRYVEGKEDFGDILQAAHKVIPEVQKQGADAIVVIIHSGLGEPYDRTYDGYSAASGLPPENVSAKLADTFPQIDAIMLGHSHKDLPQLVRNGVVLTQADKWGKRLAIVDLHFAKTNGRWKVIKKDATTLNTEAVTPDAGLLALGKKANEETLAYVNSPIGSSTGEWSAAHSKVEDTAIIDLVNEVEKDKTGADLATASVFNDGAHLPKGTLTISDLSSLYVYDNTLTTIRLNGKQLRAYLENSAKYYNAYKPGGEVFSPEIPAYDYDMVTGVNYAIDVTKPVGSRITQLDYKGKPVQDNQSFTMALNSYRQNGGGGYTMIKNAPVIKANFTEIRDLMINYVKEHKVISPEKTLQNNWRLLPAGIIAPDGTHYR